MLVSSFHSCKARLASSTLDSTSTHVLSIHDGNTEVIVQHLENLRDLEMKQKMEMEKAEKERRKEIGNSDYGI